MIGPRFGAMPSKYFAMGPKTPLQERSTEKLVAHYAKLDATNVEAENGMDNVSQSAPQQEHQASVAARDAAERSKQGLKDSRDLQDIE